MDSQTPIRLLKSETLLPANILDVQYYQTFEFGLMEYIVVQNDMFEDINDENTFWIFFSEEADDFFYDHSENRKPSQLHPEFLFIMKEYVKKSFADKTQFYQNFLSSESRSGKRIIQKVKLQYYVMKQ